MRAFWSRWLFLVLGGALSAPYALLVAVALPLAFPTLAIEGSLVFTVLAVGLLVVALVATSFVPAVRALEAAVVPALLQGAAVELEVTAAETTADRVRNTGWYLLHTVLGAIVSLMSLVLPPVAVGLLVGGARGDASIPLGSDGPIAIDTGWAVVLAVALLASLVLVVAGAGAWAAWAAPRLLGPDPRSRLADLERRTAELTERTRLARELHDTIGHALTVTTLQASAARSVLHTDPSFAEGALLAIEQTGRVAATDLDDFLGLLREDPAARAPQPTLDDLGALVASHRGSGPEVVLVVDGNVAGVATVVSREVYRIVQEGLTNVRRHAGPAPTRVDLEIRTDVLTVSVRNDGPGTGFTPSRGGGRGLAGVRERVALLGGELAAGPTGDDGWLLTATVPTGARR